MKKRGANGKFAPIGESRKTVAERSQQTAVWQHRNPEKMRAYRKAWLEKNQERRRQWRAAYDQRNKDRLAERALEWARKNRDKVNAKTRAWWKANPAKTRALIAKRRAALLRRTPAWADLVAIEKFYVESRRLTAETGIEHHVDHLIPLQGRRVCGLHVETNLQVIPAAVNRSKNNHFHPGEFDAHAAQ